MPTGDAFIASLDSALPSVVTVLGTNSNNPSHRVIDPFSDSPPDTPDVTPVSLCC